MFTASCTLLRITHECGLVVNVLPVLVAVTHKPNMVSHTDLLYSHELGKYLNRLFLLQAILKFLSDSDFQHLITV